MAKKMGFSVVGLPHYTIWHLYEPSLDDLRHMEEMDQERKAREALERVEAERTKEQFKDPRAQWEKDGAAVHNLMQKDQGTPRDNAGGQQGANGGNQASPSPTPQAARGAKQ